jgi:hypothetical protein
MDGRENVKLSVHVLRRRFLLAAIVLEGEYQKPDHQFGARRARAAEEMMHDAGIAWAKAVREAGRDVREEELGT